MIRIKILLRGKITYMFLCVNKLSVKTIYGFVVIIYGY